MVKVKVCGITNYRDAEAACRFGADALGFVFAKSPRRVSPKKAKEIIDRLPPYVLTVGVFVDRKKEEVLKIARECRLDRLQLHGSESYGYCKELKKYYKIIKAIRVGGRRILRELSGYDADALLLDSFVPGKSGGTGIRFDWQLALEAKRCGKPVIVSGGLNAGNVKDAVKKIKPYAVDASSGLESSPGRKDHGLMKKFIERAKRVT